MHSTIGGPGRIARRALVVFGAAALTLVIVARAYAHDTWLMSESNAGQVGSAVRLYLTSGETFPVDDFAIEPSRVARAVVREGGSGHALPKPRTAEQALLYQWMPRTPGLATIGIELHPKTLTLEPKLIEEYLDEIDASAEVRATWQSMGDKQKWTESYTKHAMTFIRIAPTKNDTTFTADKSWRRPIGMGLEFVPERDPTALRAGDTLIVRVLRRGVPLVGFSVGAIREGRSKAAFFRTDKLGRAAVIVDAQGRWLLNGTQLRRAASGATVWESDFVTASLHVAPRP